MSTVDRVVLSGRGTDYVARVQLGDGITVEARVYVPTEVAYRDQHELTEVSQSGLALMLGMVARTPGEPAVDPFVVRCSALDCYGAPGHTTPCPEPPF